MNVSDNVVFPSVSFPSFAKATAGARVFRGLCLSRSLFVPFVYFVVATLAPAQSVPPYVNYQGRVTTRDGASFTNTTNLTFSIHATNVGGTAVWGPRVFTGVPVVDGHFSVVLGEDADSRPVTDAFTNAATWVEIVCGDFTNRPRQQILSVPYAAAADTAGRVRVEPASYWDIVGGASAPGSIRLADDGTLLLNVDGTASGWRTIGGAEYSEFDDPRAWSVFDPGDHGDIGDHAVGYRGGVFDGEYVYFIPYSSDAGKSGEVLRYAVESQFSSSNSWEAFDAGAHVNADARGYSGGVYARGHVYFAPDNGRSSVGGVVLRFNTTAGGAGFTNSSFWEHYSPSGDGRGGVGDDYIGALFDGNHVYFAPSSDNASGGSADFLRYDTGGVFTNAGSWEAHDPRGQLGIGTVRFAGGVFDGRYVYFVPSSRGSDSALQVCRYDPRGAFSSQDSWLSYPPHDHGDGEDTDRYQGGVYDGRYVYFIPQDTSTPTETSWGRVLRYDTLGSFTNALAWEAYSAAEDGIGEPLKGFGGGAFDGRYIYCIPYHNSEHQYGEILRYDTRRPFAERMSWEVFWPRGEDIGSDPEGFQGAVFDGRYLYCVPHADGGYGGEVLRFDARRPRRIPSTIRGGSFF
jgi:hypothetical protein